MVMKSPDASDRASQAPVRDPRAAASTAAIPAIASLSRADVRSVEVDGRLAYFRKVRQVWDGGGRRRTM